MFINCQVHMSASPEGIFFIVLMYVHMYVSTYICDVHMCMCLPHLKVYKHVLVLMYVHMYVSAYICEVHMCVCLPHLKVYSSFTWRDMKQIRLLYVCMYVCMYVCICNEDILLFYQDDKIRLAF